MSRNGIQGNRDLTPRLMRTGKIEAAKFPCIIRKDSLLQIRNESTIRKSSEKQPPVKGELA